MADLSVPYDDASMSKYQPPFSSIPNQSRPKASRNSQSNLHQSPSSTPPMVYHLENGWLIVKSIQNR